MSKFPPRLTAAVVVLTVLAPAVGSASVTSVAEGTLDSGSAAELDADSRDRLRADVPGAVGADAGGESRSMDAPRFAGDGGAYGERDSTALASTLADDPITVDYLVELTPEEPNSVRVTARFAVPRRVSRFVVTLPEGATVTDSYGFERGDGSREYEMDGTTAEPSITYEIDPRSSHELFGGLESTDEGSWAFVTTESVGIDGWHYWWDEGDNPGVAASMTVVDDGIGGSSMAYLGETSITERRTDGQSIRLVVPTESSVDEDAIFRTLDDTSRLLRVGDRDPHVTVFVARDPMREGGRHVYNGEMARRTTAQEEDVWIHESASPTGEANVWVHEYVHTRQAYVPGERMTWLDEGIANYYERLVPLYRGDADFETFHRGVATDRQADAVLLGSDPGEAQYTKGARVVAALDAKIRAETDGERTFQDVFARLNRHDGEITYRVFADVVADVAGTRLDGWLDRYVAGDEAPPVPDDPARFAPPGERDTGDDQEGTDGTGSPTETETPTDEPPASDPTDTETPTETESPTATPTETESPTDEPTERETPSADSRKTESPTATKAPTDEPAETTPETDTEPSTETDTEDERPPPARAPGPAPGEVTLEYLLDAADDEPGSTATGRYRVARPVPIPA